MKSRVSAILLLALLGCAAVLPARADDISDSDEDDMIDIEEDEYEDVELDDSKAVLIAHKFIQEKAVIQGKNMTVKIILHNVGKGSATNIKIDDGAVDKKLYKLVGGSPQGTIDRINPGASAEHTYVVVPQRGNMRFFGPSASIKFSAMIEAPPTQELFSTTAHANVLTIMQSMQVHLLSLGRILSFGVLKTSSEWINSIAVIGASALLFGINYLVRWYTVSTGERKRAKARAELGADS